MVSDRSPRTLNFARPEVEVGVRYGLRGGYLSSGREITDKFELNKLFEMSLPGDYRIVFFLQVGGSEP